MIFTQARPQTVCVSIPTVAWQAQVGVAEATLRDRSERGSLGGTSRSAILSSAGGEENFVENFIADTGPLSPHG